MVEDKIKNWLKDKEIYFLVITVFISSFSLFWSKCTSDKQAELSEQQTRLSERQTKLSEFQTQISEKQILPLFLLIQTNEPHFEGNIWNDKIHIYNKGEAFRDLKAEGALFLDVVIRKGKGQKQVFNIPFKNYYLFFGSEHKIGDDDWITGEVATIEGAPGNHSLYMPILMEFQMACKKKNMYGIFDLKRYVKLSYQDILGSYHTDYYFVEGHLGGKLIDPVNGKDIFKKYNDAIDNNHGIYFSQLTPEKIFEVLEYD